MRYVIILVALIATLTVSNADDIGTLTIKGTQTTTGALAIRDGITVTESRQGVCGVRLIIKKVPDQMVGGNNQVFFNRQLFYEIEPDVEQDYIDEEGSPCYLLVWGDTLGGQVHYPDSETFAICQYADMSLALTLDGLEDGTPYDYVNCPDSVARFLLPVPYEIQSDNPVIIDFAQSEFTYACQFRYEVVANVIKWIIENLRYRSPSDDSAHFDALGVFSDTLNSDPDNRYRTDCKGFTRLSIAFLRALGIPARFVSGTTFAANYRVPRGDGTFLTILLNHGAHAWLEVYYPQAGWVPYDGQNFLHHTDALRCKKSHGKGYHEAHPEIYRPFVKCPNDGDWVHMYLEEGDWSTLDCNGTICSVDNFQFVSHDPTYPTRTVAIADSAYAPAGACCVVAGDANDDGKVTGGDAVFIIAYIFRGGPEPSCMTAADANHDCRLTVGDSVYIINFIFKGGPPPVCVPCKSSQKRGGLTQL